MATHPTSGQKRITITGTVINNARNVAFLVTGATKAVKIRKILHQEKGAELFPAAHIAPAHGQLFWFLDKGSIGKLAEFALVGV